MTNLNLLNNQQFLDWCYWPITELSLLNCWVAKRLKPYADIESNWWNSMKEWKWKISWTWPLCQNATKQILTSLWYKNVLQARKIKSTTSKKRYEPDLECDDFVWEVKWRSWTTTWTWWEKILWTPLKYSEIPRLYWKPLKIVCVWYQEWEAKNWFACWNLINPEERWTEELQKMLILLKKLNIEYIWFTELLAKLKKVNQNSWLRLKN